MWKYNDASNYYNINAVFNILRINDLHIIVPDSSVVDADIFRAYISAFYKTH